MMPSAKIENVSSAPPEKRLTSPNMVLRACSKNCARALPSIPGVGTATPMRYTASMANVNNSRRRSSGILDAFANPSTTSDDLGTAAGGLQPLDCRSAELVGLHSECLRQRPVRENLDRSLQGADQPGCTERVAVHHRASLEARLELTKIDDAELSTERVVEAELWQAALQGHLAAFVPRGRVAAGARAAALV